MSKFNLENISALAFDFDNTIAQGNLHHQARLQAFTEMHDTTGDSRYLEVSDAIHNEAHRHGSNPTTIIGWTLQQVGIVEPAADLHSHAVLAEAVNRKHAAYDLLVANGADEIEGATSFIIEASKLFQGKLSIVTTARVSEEVMPFLKRYNLMGYFPEDSIFSRESVEANKQKPHPKAYELAVEKFGLKESPNRLLAFEDTFHGIEAAKKAGATVLAIATTHTVSELSDPKVQYKPDYVTETYTEISKLFGF